MQDEILVLDYRLARLDWLGRGPDVAVCPLQSALEVLPITQLFNISGDAKVFAELRFVMDVQGQIEVIAVVGIRLALLILWTRDVLLLRQRPLLGFGAQLRANALEHVAPFVGRLGTGQVLQKLLLLPLRHSLYWPLWRGVYPGSGRIGQDRQLLLERLAIFKVSFLSRHGDAAIILFLHLVVQVLQIVLDVLHGIFSGRLAELSPKYF